MRAVMRMGIQRGRLMNRMNGNYNQTYNIWRPLNALDSQTFFSEPHANDRFATTFQSRTIFTESQRSQNRLNHQIIQRQNNPWGIQQKRTVMGPVARILAQVGLALASAVGRAFVQAFMQQRAAMKAGKGGAGAAAAGFVKKDIMDRQQALEILNADENSTKEEIQSNYDKLFAANDPAKGGSFYLQSKIYRAKECLDAGEVADGEKASE